MGVLAGWVVALEIGAYSLRPQAPSEKAVAITSVARPIARDRFFIR
jgi:hypothetical protein